jgi:hypothetical protein
VEGGSIVGLSFRSEVPTGYKQIVRLDKYVQPLGIGGFINSSIEATINTFTELPRVKAKENLYYMVLPSGCGKTTLCDKYGFIDIDACMSGGDRGFLQLALCYNMQGADDKAKEAGQQWVLQVMAMFGCTSFDRPTLVLVHDDATGYATGAVKIGSANLPLEVKKKGKAMLGQVAKRLVEKNDEIFRALDSDDSEKASYAEVESWVLTKARKHRIGFNDPTCYDALGKSKVEAMSMSELVEGWKAGQVSREYVECRAFDDREYQRCGFCYPLSVWMLALNGAYRDLSHTGQQVAWAGDADSYLGRAEMDGHLDIEKLRRSKMDSETKAVVVSWWIATGRYMEKSGAMFRLLCGLSSGARHALVSFGMLLRRSRFMFGVAMSDSDRCDVMGLCRLFGFRGEAELYESKDMEARDSDMMLHRVLKSRGKMQLSANQVQVISEYSGAMMSTVGTSTGDVSDILDGWSTKESLSLFMAVKRIGKEGFVGTGRNVKVVIDCACIDESRQIERIAWRPDMLRILDEPASRNPGVGDVVLEKGYCWLRERGKETMQEIGPSQLENMMMGREAKLEPQTPVWKVGVMAGLV